MNRPYHAFGTITDTKGNAKPGWFVECVVLDTTTVVPIYADENETAIVTLSGVANRAKSDADGNYDLFVEAGTYSLRFYDEAGVLKRIQRYMTMDGVLNFTQAANAGYVTPEQFGAVGDDIANDLPAWQAMVAFAKASGIKACRCAPGATYAWWAPVVSVATVYDAFHVTNPANFLTISHDFDIDFAGSTVNCKAWDGSSLQTTLQTLTYLGSPTAWRGNAINVIGGTAGTSSFGIKRVALRNGKIFGGCTRDAGGLAASDYISHKGFRIQDTGVETLFFENMEIYGFRGEAWYIGALYPTKTTAINCKGHTGNQSAWNPSVGDVTVIGGEFGNCPIACEGIGGAGHLYVGTRFYDSTTGVGWYGGAGYGGTFGATSFTQPTNAESLTTLPWVTFDNVLLDDCTSFSSANYLRGTIRAIDTNFTFESSTAGENHDIDLTIDHVTHKRGGGIVTVQGPATTTTVYGAGFVKLPRNIKITVRNSRTKYAIDNSIQASATFDPTRLVDQASVTLVGEETASTRFSVPTTPQTMPRIVARDPVGTGSFGALIMGATQITTTAGGTAYALSIYTPRIALINTGAAGVVTVTIAAPFAAPGGYAFGQRVRIHMAGGGTAGTTMYFPKAGAGLQLNEDRRLIAREEWIEMEWNDYTAKWCEVNFFSQTPARCTIAQLPAAAAIYNGDRITVTDCLAAYGAGAIGAAPVAGGAFHQPVICLNAVWVVE